MGWREAPNQKDFLELTRRDCSLGRGRGREGPTQEEADANAASLGGAQGRTFKKKRKRKDQGYLLSVCVSFPFFSKKTFSRKEGVGEDEANNRKPLLLPPPPSLPSLPPSLDKLNSVDVFFFFSLSFFFRSRSPSVEERRRRRSHRLFSLLLPSAPLLLIHDGKDAP